MFFLLIYNDNNQKINLDEFKNALNSISINTQIIKIIDGDSILTVNYEENENKGYLRVSGELDSITIYGKNSVDLKVILALSSVYPLLNNWYLTDIDYSFNFQLKEARSLTDLKKKTGL